AIELALVERAAVVGADVVDGVEAAIDVAQGDSALADIVDPDLAGLDIGGAAEGLPVADHQAGTSRLAAMTRRMACQAVSSTLGRFRRSTTLWKKPSSTSSVAAASVRPRAWR